ncbi:hypothetical protein NQ176_g10777 [Zarea fungicola]|uniref:Uncharacterized protein n=1 Tax=Zarea fungicola TaxID=93591 RepID=A0ACC1MDK8_9HYPO|nr:hypothetical protein NQ176_g10777 [Lecanicillium fungicola]
MKLLSVLSATLALATGMAAAAPTNATSDESMMRAVNITDAPSSLLPVQINEKAATGPLPEVLSKISNLLDPKLAGSFQKAAAELLKGGDFILNGPVDAIEQLLKMKDLDPKLRTALSEILDLLKSLPKDAVGGGKKP